MPDKVKSKWGEHKSIVTYSIKFHGSGQHPVPNDENIEFFEPSYAKYALKKARKDIHPEHKEALESAIKHVEGMMETRKANIKEAIVAIIEDKQSLFKENIENVLYDKVAEKLNETKVEVASRFFGRK